MLVLPIVVTLPYWIVVYLLTVERFYWIHCITFYLATVFILPYAFYFNVYGGIVYFLIDYLMEKGIILTLITLYILYLTGCLLVFFIAPIMHEFFDWVPLSVSSKRLVTVNID